MWGRAARACALACWTLASISGCRVGGGRVPVAATQAPSPQFAPIYKDGPVPVPGEKLEVPFVAGRNGKPIIVASIAPGSLVTFPLPDARRPANIIIKRRPSPGESTTSDVPPLTVTPKPPRAGQDGAIAFDVPQLPRGIYDAWYVDGRPASPSKSVPSAIEPLEPKASQSVTFEVKPRLKALRSVVRARPGADVDVVIGIAGTGSSKAPPIEVTLSGMNSVVHLAPAQSERVVIGSDGLARFKLRVAANADVYVAATAPGYEGTVVRVVGGPDYPFRDARLQPGDLLLCQGNKIVSRFIQAGEYLELGRSSNANGRPFYSHVAIYLGSGETETAEMLDDGLVKHKLEDTRDGCTTLDVYRRIGIAPAEQSRVASNILNYRQAPYAWGQIKVFGWAGALGLDLKVARSPTGWFFCGLTLGVSCVVEAVAIAEIAPLKAGLADAARSVSESESGKRTMICSELAAWAYQDAGLQLEVAPWWHDVQDEGLLNSADARSDYTSPNMIARSKNVAFRFQLWPPVPPSVAVVAGQVQITEEIQFDSGSATIGKESDDVLLEVARTLIEHTEMKKVRVEGHTDNIGGSALNKELSQRRAGAVVKWLVAHGVEASRLISVGVGDARPIAPNDTETNRHKNRRVEFHLGE